MLECASTRWSRSTKFILVGCGRIGHCYATVIADHPQMKLAAVIDTNPESANAFGHSFRCNAYTSLEAYLASRDRADCAVIATPPHSHADIAIRLMENGIHVFCEPPLALDVATAQKMTATAAAKAVRLMMGSKFRFVPDVIQAKGLMQAGILGHILEFEGDFREAVDMSTRWNVQPEISGGGVLMDSGPLTVDVVRYMFGPVQAIGAEEGRRVQSKDVEDTVRLELNMDPGILGTLHLSWALKSHSEDYFRIYGTQGNMCIGWKRSMYRPNGAADWIRFGEGYSTQKAQRTQLQHFVEVIDGEEAPEIAPEEALESVRVIETAYQSLETGKHIDLLDTPADPALAAQRKLSLISSSKTPFPTWIFGH